MVSFALDIRGAQLQVREHGSGAATIWAHGLLSSMDAEEQAGKWRQPPPGRLLRYDARGHGGSSAATHSQQCSWDSLAADLLGLADGVQLERFRAAGVSMGAATAVRAALLAPERVSALVLVAPPPLWEARSLLAGQYRRIARADARVIEKMVESGLRVPDWVRQARPAPHDRRSIANAAVAYLGAAESNLPSRASLQALAAIPALIIGWEGDAAHPLESAQALHALLPCSNLHIVSSIDQYRQLPHVVSAFLDR